MRLMQMDKDSRPRTSSEAVEVMEDLWVRYEVGETMPEVAEGHGNVCWWSLLLFGTVAASLGGRLTVARLPRRMWRTPHVRKLGPHKQLSPDFSLLGPGAQRREVSLHEAASCKWIRTVRLPMRRAVCFARPREQVKSMCSSKLQTDRYLPWSSIRRHLGFSRSQLYWH
jgi:hypothetical protein